MDDRSVKYHGHKIFYRVFGKGAPVILIHGFGEDGSIWDRQVNDLQTNFQFIIPDLPGTGKSYGALEAESEWSMEKFADIIRLIAIEEKLEKFTLLGHSMGGYISLAFASLWPGILQGLGLIHSTAFADTPEKIETRQKGIAFIKKMGADLFLRQLIPNLYGDAFKCIHPEEINRQVEAAMGFTNESLISYYEAMIRRPDRIEVLLTFQKPVLFIIGAEDKAVNLADSLAQCHLPEESHVHFLEKSGHMGMCEEALKTTSAIKEFLWRLNEN